MSYSNTSSTNMGVGILRRAILIIGVLAVSMSANDASAACIYNKTGGKYAFEIFTCIGKRSEPSDHCGTFDRYMSGTIWAGSHSCTRGEGGPFRVAVLKTQSTGQTGPTKDTARCQGNVPDHGYVEVFAKEETFNCAGGLACPGGTTYKGARIVCNIVK